MENTFDGDNFTETSFSSNEQPANVISAGITDFATKQTLIVEDDKITVQNISVKTLQGNTTVRGDLKVYGILDAGLVRTTELIANQRYEKQYIEFAQNNEQGTNIGTGLLWPGKPYNKQLIYRNNPDRFFMSENVELPANRSFMIDGNVVVNSYSLGGGVVSSSLKQVGTLERLNVSGDVNFNDMLFFNSRRGAFSIGNANPSSLFSVYDVSSDVEVFISGNTNGNGRIGAAGYKGLDVVTDNQVRLTVENNGNITLGQEGRDSTNVRVYGKLSVGIKTPKEQLEVAGNIKFANMLMTSGTESPKTGSYSVGDIVWNSAPRPTGWVGWICIVAGSPGVWKSFGQIAS